MDVELHRDLGCFVMATPAGRRPAGPDRFLIATNQTKLGNFYHLQFVWETPLVETRTFAPSSNAINFKEGMQFGAAVSKKKNPDPLPPQVQPTSINK